MNFATYTILIFLGTVNLMVLAHLTGEVHRMKEKIDANHR